jgi:hypothetical protein
MSATTDTISRSEILERATAIHTSAPVEEAPHILTPEESEILRQADLITNERRSTGITGVIESALAAIRGERASAELALQKARQREAELETLIQQKAGVLKAIERERDALAGIEALIIDYRKRTSPKAERDQMRSRFHARMDARFQEHLPHAVQGILEARLILEMLPDYAQMSRAEILKMEADLGEIDRKISKAKK